MSDTSISATQPSAQGTAAADPVWADWVTVWQSEMAALAVDREVHEAVQRAAGLWAATALAAGGDAAGRAGAAAPARAASAADAPDRGGGGDADGGGFGGGRGAAASG